MKLTEITGDSALDLELQPPRTTGARYPIAINAIRRIFLGPRMAKLLSQSAGYESFSTAPGGYPPEQCDTAT
jgi:hypothetical protein